MINFSLNLKTRIHFGRGAVSNLKSELQPYKKILLVTGSGSVKKYGIYDAVMTELSSADKEVFEISGVKPNPSIDSVYAGIKICKEKNIDFILALGGGSVIDAAKAIAAGVVYDGDVWDLYLDGSKLIDALKTGAILTIAATGSESNGNSVITNEKTTEKLPLRNNILRPEFAILDPSYTFTLPPIQTAAGVSDIMAHVFEQYFSPTKDAFLADRLCEATLKTCIKYGPILMKEPENYEARAEIMWASNIALNGILTCGKITDWATHMIDHELSAYYDLNHGIGLAILFPNWMNQVADESRLWKFKDFAINVWDLPVSMSDRELADASIQKTREYFNGLNLPSKLSEVGIDDKYFEIMAENIIRRKTNGNFKILDKEDVVEIYRLSL
ncbi:MAG TPA: NADH-dependent alcohol dehydrogenase [Cyanobacteria bacterium UBA9971]|nr:NADH-dependent alcohol dehydrogenase [Cyanobacteria bacterium UBA9971]